MAVIQHPQHYMRIEQVSPLRALLDLSEKVGEPFAEFPDLHRSRRHRLEAPSGGRKLCTHSIGGKCQSVLAAYGVRVTAAPARA